MDRRNSDDSAPSRRASTADVFDDDYEVDVDEDDFMPSVSDGFRPANATANEGWASQRHANDRFQPPQRHTSTSKAPENDLRRTATRNSTAKVRDPVVHDGRPPALQHRELHSQSTHSHSHRESVSSTASFATTSNSENPFETGPSHPYGMYPQHTMARSASVATASTTQQPDRPMSVQRPAHPYAMYSQSGLDDEPSAEPMPPVLPPIQTNMAVGFPGLDAGYRRVLGPDGEEQDIIGPDGHTEQLPPYSQYPDEGPTKASMAAQASASRIIPAPLNSSIDAEDPFASPTSPTSPFSVASSLDLSPHHAATASAAAAAAAAPLLPSITPARLPPQRPETQTGNMASTTSANAVPAAPSDSSSASLLETEEGYTEKADPAPEKTDWRKKKLWGKIPVGLAFVIFLAILVIAIALGAAIGTVMKKKNSEKADNKNNNGRPDKEPQPQVTGPSGALFGATPISTPDGFPLLPTGAFSLPLGFPQSANPGCLVQASEFSAWSCKMTFAPLIFIVNNTIVDDSGTQQQVASSGGGSLAPEGMIQYGLQTPNISLELMQLVKDLDLPDFGPAYHFQTKYDKIVVLRPEDLGAGSSLKKRQNLNDMPLRQQFIVQPGDFPWFCYWNETYIEGYVYAQNNSTAASLTAYPTMWPTNSPSPTTTLESEMVVAATMPPSTTTSSMSSASSQSLIAPSSVIRRDSASDPASPSRIPPYPRIVKIEERRLAGSPQPYCRRMVMLDNGVIAPAPNGNDPIVTLGLQESDPSYDDYMAAAALSSSSSSSRKGRRDEVAAGFERRDEPSNSCHCQWMFK